MGRAEPDPRRQPAKRNGRGLASPGPLDSGNFAEFTGPGTLGNFSSVSAAMTNAHALHATSFTVGHAYISGGFSLGTMAAPTPTDVVERAKFTLD